MAKSIQTRAIVQIGPGEQVGDPVTVEVAERSHPTEPVAIGQDSREAPLRVADLLVRDDGDLPLDADAARPARAGLAVQAAGGAVRLKGAQAGARAIERAQRPEHIALEAVQAAASDERSHQGLAGLVLAVDENNARMTAGVSREALKGLVSALESMREAGI